METPSPWQDTVFLGAGLLCLAADLWHIPDGLCGAAGSSSDSGETRKMFLKENQVLIKAQGKLQVPLSSLSRIHLQQDGEFLRKMDPGCKPRISIPGREFALIPCCPWSSSFIPQTGRFQLCPNPGLWCTVPAAGCVCSLGCPAWHCFPSCKPVWDWCWQPGSCQKPAGNSSQNVPSQGTAG